jgi:threonine synthase
MMRVFLFIDPGRSMTTHLTHLVTDRSVRRYGDIRDLIGCPEDPTPLVRLSRLTPATAELYLKLEWMNPFGSIKDRTAAYLLAGMAERREERAMSAFAGV